MSRKFIYLLIATFFYFPSFSQDLPKEMTITPDGRRLILGGNQTTGFYDDTQVKVVELEFDQNNFWDLLDEDTPAKLIYEGVEYEGVGIRFKGATSNFMNNTQKKSFNVSLDFTNEDLDIEGYQTTNFNCGFQDPSNIREVLFNWIGRHYNPSLKSNFIHLKINGENWGAYTNVQQLNKDFIQEWFLNGDGSRFRCIDPNFTPGMPSGPPPAGPCNGAGGGGPGGGGSNGWTGGPSSLNWLGADTTEYQENYDLKGTDRPDPWSDLITPIDKLNNLPIEELADSLPYYFDVDKTLWYLAHELMLTDEDGYIYKGKMDYYVYFDDATEVLLPLEYDGNSTMENNLVDWSPFKRADDECFPLVYRLMQVPEFRQRYLAHCRTIINDYMDIDMIHEKIDFYADLINDLEANDPIGDQLFSYNQYLNGINQVKNFFEDRRDFLLANNEIDREGLDISNVTYSVDGISFEQPSYLDEVSVTATISNGNAQQINLYFGEGFMGRFDMVEMMDDGLHGDGAAGDGIFGGYIPFFPKGTYVRYYVEAIKADNFGTRTYEPVGAEHDVYIYQVKPGEFVASDVIINEFMSSNDATQADQDEEFDDWIELYNKSNTTIDLSGYFLSDDATNPMKWEFPAGSTIDGNGYLIIWADEDEDQEGLHANFKLSKDGEALYLSNTNGEIADQVIFGSQETDQSYARSPNGTGDFVIKPPTFGTNNDNTTSTFNTEVSNSRILVYPNPASQAVTIELTGSESFSPSFQIYNALGMLIQEGFFNGKTSLDVSLWSKGIYLVKIGDKLTKLIID